MLSFPHALVFEDPELGCFKRVGTMWFPAEPRAGLRVTMEGGEEGPSPEVVEIARRLLHEPEALVQAARAYVQADAEALEFMQNNGELICDGFTVYQSGSFDVEFSLSECPDAMISVPFAEGVPCNVVLGH